LAKRLEMPGGVIVADKFGASTLSDTIANVIEKSELYEPLPRTVFDTTRAWTWPIVSLEYVEQFRAALTDCGMAAS
jgi:hypothetical protein